MCCCFKVLSKIIILIVNFTVILIGIGLITIGSLLVSFRSNLPEFFFIDSSITAYAFIGIGCFVFLVAFCGCCGAIADSGCLLITYAILTFILAGFNIYIAITLTNNKEEIKSAFGDDLERIFENSTDTFNSLEYVFRCCGTTGVDSYDKIGSSFPPTCCQNISIIIVDIDAIDEIKDQFCSKEETNGGCLDVLNKYIDLITDILFIIFIGFVTIQLLVAIFAAILANIACKNSATEKGRVIHPPPPQMSHQRFPRPMPSQQLQSPVNYSSPVTLLASRR